MGHHRTHRTSHTMTRERASTMHRRRVRSAVGVRLSAVVVCAALVAGLSACDGGGGAVPTAPAAEASTPLDGVLCDVLPTDLLTDALGFDSYTYTYFHNPISGGGYNHPGYYYVCMLQSDYTTWAMLEIHYDPDDAIPHQTEFGSKVGSVEFDRSDLAPELCLVGDGVVGVVVDLQHRPGRVVGLEHAHVVVAGVVVAAPGYWVMEIGVGVGVEAEGVGQQVGRQDVAQHSVERGGRLRRGRGRDRPAPAVAGRQTRDQGGAHHDGGQADPDRGPDTTTMHCRRPFSGHGVACSVGAVVAHGGRACSMVWSSPGMGWSWHSQGRADWVRLIRLVRTSPRVRENSPTVRTR